MNFSDTQRFAGMKERWNWPSRGRLSDIFDESDIDFLFNLVDELNLIVTQPMYMEWGDTFEDYESCVDAVRYFQQALELIAAPKRADGTYNRCREACEELARKALDQYQSKKKKKD